MATTMTTMNSVKFVRQVHMQLAPLVQTGALQQRAYTALMSGNTKWVRCPDGLTSTLPKNDPLQIGCSQNYDAFKYGSDCVAASGSQGMWAGMAAYRFQLPADVVAGEGKDAARLLNLTVDAFTDKFLLGGVAISAGFSIKAEPDDVDPGLLNSDDQPFPLPYATKVAGYEAPVMGDLAAGSAEGTNKYETLTLFDSAVEGGGAELPVPGPGQSVYLWVFIRLFDYTELKWEYWIEGSAGLDADTVTVTWDRDVIADPASEYTLPNYDLAYNRILPVETTWCNRSGCIAGWLKYTVVADDTPACLRPGHYSSTTLVPGNPYPDSPDDIDARVMLDNLMYFYSSTNRAVAFTAQEAGGNNNDLEYMNYNLGADNWKYKFPSMLADISNQSSYWAMPDTLRWPAVYWTYQNYPGARLNFYCALTTSQQDYPGAYDFVYVPAIDGINWHMVFFAHASFSYNTYSFLGAWASYHSKWDNRSAGGAWTVVESIVGASSNSLGAGIALHDHSVMCVLKRGNGRDIDKKARIAFADFCQGQWGERVRKQLGYWEHTDAASKLDCKDQIYRNATFTLFTYELQSPSLTELADGSVLVAGADLNHAYNYKSNYTDRAYIAQDTYDSFFATSTGKSAHLVTIPGSGATGTCITISSPNLIHAVRPLGTSGAGSNPMSPSLLLNDGRVLLLDWELVRPSTDCVTTFDEEQNPIYTPPSTTATQVIELYDSSAMAWNTVSVNRDMLGEAAYTNSSPGRGWRGVLLPDGNVFMYGELKQVKRKLITLQNGYTYGRDEFGGTRRAWCIFDATTSTMSEFNFVGMPYSCNASMLLLQDQVTILFAEAGSMHTFNTVTHVWTKLGNSPGYVGRGRMFAPPAAVITPSLVDVNGCRVVTTASTPGQIRVTAECACRRVFAYVPGQFKPAAVRLRINPAPSTNTAARILIVADTRDIKADSPLADAGRIKAYYSGILDPADVDLGLTVVGQAMVPFAGAASTLDIAISELPKGRNSLWIVIMPTGTWGLDDWDANKELERFEIQVSKTLLVGSSK